MLRRSGRPLNGAPEDIPYLLSRLDEYGGEKSYPNYSVGWACAGATPATWCIQMAHGGGNMAGMVVHWPKGIAAKGELRRQYASLIDIVPTILEAVGVPEPKVVNGHEQTPMAGVSMRYCVRRRPTPTGRHITQYNECAGNRSIYHDGWLAAVVHRAPWEHTPRVDDFAKDRWELYHMDEDFGLANDLAAQHPDKVKEMQDLFLAEAIKNNVLPLDDRAFERLNPVAAGRPDLMFGRTTLTLYPGMTGMTENGFINTKAVSYTIDAELEIPAGGAEGVVLSQAGQGGGWSLYVKDGKPKYAYNWLARESVHGRGQRPPARGQGQPALRLRLRRRRPAQGRDRHALRQRREGRRGAHRADHGSRLLAGRRDRGRRRGRLVPGDRRLRPLGQRLHRHDPQDHRQPDRPAPPSGRGERSPHTPKLIGHGARLPLASGGRLPSLATRETLEEVV